MRLAGKKALVTGAAGGIGAATALALAQEGADVALVDLHWNDRPGNPAGAIRALGRNAMEIACDVSDLDKSEAAFAEAVAALGAIDILVTSAVFSDREFFYKADMKGFRKTLDVSMWGAFHFLRAASRHLIDRQAPGSIVLVSSPHAHVPTPSCMAYNMAKAALDMMGKTAATELLGKGIRVNMIYPGWTDTPGERKFFTEETLRVAGAALPMKRLMRPDEVARGVVFLCDPASESITGTILSIDGGTQLPWWSKRGTGEF